jgi:hypothetical protein
MPEPRELGPSSHVENRKSNACLLG